MSGGRNNKIILHEKELKRGKVFLYPAPVMAAASM